MGMSDPNFRLTLGLPTGNGRRLLVDATGETMGAFPSLAEAIRAARSGDRIAINSSGLICGFVFPSNVGLDFVDWLPDSGDQIADGWYPGE